MKDRDSKERRRAKGRYEDIREKGEMEKGEIRGRWRKER